MLPEAAADARGGVIARLHHDRAFQYSCTAGPLVDGWGEVVLMQPASLPCGNSRHHE